MVQFQAQCASLILDYVFIHDSVISKKQTISNSMLLMSYSRTIALIFVLLFLIPPVVVAVSPITEQVVE